MARRNKSKRFQRPTGERSYKKLFIIAAEGANSEPQYFAIFNWDSIIKVKCPKSRNQSSPSHVLKRMKQYLTQEGFNEKTDEAWLVIDKDQWTDKQLAELYQWSKKQENYGFALSNPKFEYWLLLHFEEGESVSGPSDCSSRLRKHLPGYDKNVDSRKFTPQHIHNAIERAKNRDNPPCVDWPRTIGTTVYKLVENILASSPVI